MKRKVCMKCRRLLLEDEEELCVDCWREEEDSFQDFLKEKALKAEKEAQGE